MDYYDTLGVPRTASQEEIKKAYRKLAMEHHPDRGGDNNKFQEISVAYDTLGDPNKRAQYDNTPRPFPFQDFGQESDGFQFNVNGFDLNDLFGHVFGQRQGNPFGQRNHQQIYRTRVTVSLVDTYNRVDQILKLNTPQGTKVINIKIPQGLQTGNQIRYDNVIDGGVLIVEFVILPDLRFDRKGDDLYANLPVSVLDLITGTKIQFTTISKRTLEVTIKPQTQPWMQLKIAGEGMPTVNGGFGDQILLIKPFIPDSIDTNIIESIKRSQNK
jgi:DnaJ-class molecular chaperone